MPVIKLLIVFFRIGMSAIGGAYAYLPILERELVENTGWLTKEEFLDVLGAVKILPGAISVKYATYAGYKIAGVPGVLAANFGNVLGPALMILLFLGLYNKYKDLPKVKSALHVIQLAIFAMIISIAFQLVDVSQMMRIKNLLIVVVSFAVFTYTRIHPVFIIVSAGLFGAFIK